MILCDIGNSYAKFFNGKEVRRVAVQDIQKYKYTNVFYINVNLRVQERLKSFTKWIDLQQFIDFPTNYEGMGIDRKVLCFGIEDGVVVDAGSAITVDVMEEGRHKGGYIIPGLRQLFASYKKISPALDVDFDPSINLEELPSNTKEAIHYGMIEPIVASITKFDKRIYCTGGDGEILQKYIPNSVYDPLLIFKHMQNIVQRNALC